MKLKNIFSGKNVFVTGHTGFKGSWLCEWLLSLGANVYGYSLEPPTKPSLFGKLNLKNRIASHVIGDVRSREELSKAINDAQPDFVFHLAAQPLVRLSYECPVETFDTNVMGTVNVLNALRVFKKDCICVCITTDKCYQNKEWLHAYRESDPMGGHDPYSASKGAAEIVISAYKNSFFHKSDGNVWVVSARAGNVIGGGDYALDRIVPDCVKALTCGNAIPVRNKVSTRPWQHVLEPLGGYLTLAGTLAEAKVRKDRLAFERISGGFNFGPVLTSNKTVAELVQEIIKNWGSGTWEDKSNPNAVHEAQLLNLATDKAFHLLGWKPCWDFEKTIQETIAWYLADLRGNDMIEFTQKQIAKFNF